MYAGAILLAEQGLLRAAYAPAWQEPFQRAYDAHVEATGALVPPLPDAGASEARISEARIAAYIAAARESQPFVAVVLRAAGDTIPEDTGEDLNEGAKATAEVLAEYLERMTEAVRAAVRREELRPRGLRRLLPPGAEANSADLHAREAQVRADAALEALAEVAYRCADLGIALDVLSALARALEDESERWRDNDESDRIAAMAQALSDNRDRALDFIGIASERSGA